MAHCPPRTRSLPSMEENRHEFQHNAAAAPCPSSFQAAVRPFGRPAARVGPFIRQLFAEGGIHAGIARIEACVLGERSANKKCALSSALFRRVEVPLALK